MKTLLKRLTIGASTAAIAAVLAVGFANPAKADWDHDGDWRRHEWEARRWHRMHPPHPHVVAPVVYSPPVVYAPPPPPPTGINLILPLNFR